MSLTIKIASWYVAGLVAAMHLAACGQVEKQTKSLVRDGNKQGPGTPQPDPTPRNRPGTCGALVEQKGGSLGLLCTRVYSHRLSFSNQAYNGAAVELPANTCTGMVLNLTKLDMINGGISTPEKLAADLTLDLRSTSVGGSFFKDSTCNTTLSGLVLSAGKTQTEVIYYKYSDSAALGGHNLTATPRSADSGQVLIAGAALFIKGLQVAPPPTLTGIKFAKEPTIENIKVGQCHPLEIITTGDTNKPQPLPTNAGPELKLLLATTSLTGSFYRDQSCSEQVAFVTVASGAAKASSLYYRDYTAGSVALKATSNISLGNSLVAQLQLNVDP